MSLIIINGNFAGPKNLQHAKFLQKRIFLNYTVFMNIKFYFFSFLVQHYSSGSLNRNQNLCNL